MAARGEADPADFKVLDSRTVPGYPYPTTTSLYPEFALSALQHVDSDLAEDVALVRRCERCFVLHLLFTSAPVTSAGRPFDNSIHNTQALYAIEASMPEAVAGNYSHWEVPYSYRSVERTWTSVGLLRDGKCILDTDLHSGIACPPGSAASHPSPLWMDRAHPSLTHSPLTAL